MVYMPDIDRLIALFDSHLNAINITIWIASAVISITLFTGAWFLNRQVARKAQEYFTSKNVQKIIHEELEGVIHPILDKKIETDDFVEKISDSVYDKLKEDERIVHDRESKSRPDADAPL